MWVAYALLLVASTAGEHVREFVVRENARAGTFIGHLGDELPDAAPPYTIVPVPGSAVNDDLRIDPHTGEIRTRVPLDRENRDHYALVAIPASGDNVRVVVRVSDENDNAPTFPTPVMNVEFSENTPRDVKRKLNPAKDPDLGVYNTQRYNIVSGNTDNAFRLSSHRERDGVLYLDLQINGFLDRETTDHYELVIEALDGGTPPLRGTMSVNITILDVNDSPPIFTESAYSASIPENATVGTPILKVSATDADSGENGQIEYSINRRQSDKESMFKIDPETGEIIVNKALDFETKELHELVVVARDKGAQPLETTAFVSIRVTDVNDNQPTIDVIFLSDDATPKISESARLDEFVARISVHDPDSKTEYSNVNVTLSGGDGHFDLRTHDNIIYLVVVALPLDRESQSFYTLNVVATDKGSPPLHASRIISLRVTDVNDNAPVFLESEYKANVLEAATPGTPVVQVSASDVDEAENSEIRYSLLPTPQSDWFAIDERSGLVTTKDRVDCETNPMPRLTVVATDRGNPPLSSTATLVVTVLDVNDNEPIFDQSFYNVTVQESEAVGSCILKMSAIDPDCGVNAIVNYTLGDALARPQFYVKPDSGELCVAAPLDYEANTDFEFPVIATDRGGLSTTAVVKIQVLDTNDNVPAFTVKDYNVSLKEGRISSSEPIVAVTATDADSGRNGAITYRIVNGNDNDAFRIDRSTGEIFVTKPALIRANGKFDLEVSATDGGGLGAPQTATVHIIVMHAGVSSALFDKPRYNFHVKEDAKIGHVVGTLKATVAERGKQPRYSIISGDPERHFTVEPLTGAIRTAGPLDRETRASYLLNVRAASGNSASFDQTQVQITLEDVNDNTPEFGTASVRVSVAESAAVGSAVYAARATDEDEGRNAQLTYQLVSATGPPNTFAVNAQHGLVTLLRPLDYENLVRHTLVISAKDGGAPSLSANFTLAVDVQDVNDNTPVFEHESYTASVLESEAINTKILEIQAIDKDTGNNARLTYRIISLDNTSNDGFFQVQPTTGWVYLARALDRETAAQHKMTITATDNGMPPLSASASLIINVIDANDNDPVFSRASYEFKVEENMNVGAFVGKIAATDADLGDNALLRYSLFPTNTSFAINPVTGILTTKDFLDREFKAVYSLFAEAKDQGTPARYSKVPVSIKVTDVNDNSPEIIDPREDVVSVREEQQPGAEVARVKAIDRDNGVNSSVTYSIVNERDSDGFGVFIIDPKSGVIKTSTVLDHEERSIYRLTVAATDGGTPPKQTVRQLKVEVLDLNDNRPTFTSSSLSFKVQEDATIGDIVGTVACCDSAINENLINGEEKQISYLLMPLTTDLSPGTFEIDRRTGSLVVARQLDRELQDEYRLEVRALDTSATNNPQSSAVTVKIEIVDVNDNAPQWPQNPINIEISEATSLGMTVFNFTAKDADAGPNGELNFRVVSSLPPSCKTFALDPLTGSLTLTATLDYEVLKEYWLVVEATDMAVNETERMSTLATVHISITDANDNVPKFVSKNKASVALNTLTGTLYQALAIDADSGDNGKVSYYISSGNELSYFAMEYDTGRLTLSKKFSSDVTKVRPGQYKINLTASDHGMPFNRQSHMILHLNLQESTNVPPRFTEAFYKANISEDIRPGSFVTRLTAKSSRGSAGNLTYIIPPGVADDKFVVDPRRGTVTIRSKIDREDRDQYSFPVYVTDASTFQSSTNFDVTTVTITVIDVNDNPPTFKTGSCYPLAVPENNDPEVIHTVAATDKDIGANGVITYSITSGNNGNKFSIDHTTGQLTARTLDRETQAKYQLTITAFDHGSPVALQGSCNISIIVEDQNDNDPIFDTGHYSAAIPENAPLDTSVIKVRATDADLGFNKRVVYSLANESQGLFRIDNKTGIIFTTGLFDREDKNVYHFEAVATDEGRYVARSQRVSVEITITDVNDNKPIFAKYPFKEKVATLTPPGQSLLRVSATDNDIGTNAEILYELIDTSNNKFRIDPTTGVLTATQSLASENGKLIHLKVMAKDKGNPPQSSIGLIEIRVGESSDQTPLLNFQNASYNVTIEENLSYGKEVLQVTAVRSDGRRQRVIYGFGNGDDQYAFEIDSNSGVIRVNNSANLDYESHPGPTRHLVVVARTEGTPVLYGYCDVTINLLDQNDNAPRFTQQQYIANVLEGNTKGEFVVQLAAKDSDRGVNARILYHIVDGNHDNAFIIEPAFSGSVKTNIVLDREIRETYKLTVIATDEGDPQMTGTATLRINVVDVNDNQPTFPAPNVIAVSEGTEVGSVLTSVTANDVDTYPALKYSITQEDNRFSIDRYSGKIVLNKALDFETKNVYEVNVSVSDNEHIAKTTLTIKVLDVNDNAPVFDEISYNRILPEGAGNVEIGSVSAKDRDSDDNGKVTYSILGESKGYYIDATSGAIFVNYSTLPSQRDSQLAVMATDHGKPNKTAVAAVRISTGATSEIKPFIGQDTYRITVNEDTERGSSLLQIGGINDVLKKYSLEFLIISGNEGDAFDVTLDGALILVNKLDRETKDSYVLGLAAVEQGKMMSYSQNKTSITVFVTVADANDNPPLFSSGDFELTVSEDAKPGSTLSKLTTSDADLYGTPNSAVIYNITSGDDDNLFFVNPLTGILTVNKSLDYDVGYTKYKLIIIACDQGIPSLCKSINVHVTIMDENDNVPAFPVNQYYETVAENERVGTSVFTARATDLDKGTYGILNYTILPMSLSYNKNDDSWKMFQIDSSTGLINTNAVFDYEQKNKYEFSVKASDVGGKSSTVKVRIDIESRDEFYPQFTQKTYNFPIPKKGPLPAGYMIGQTTATDRDKGVDGRIVYQLSTSHPYFKINRTTGVIILKKRVESVQSLFGNHKTISLVITASSGRQGSLTNKTAVEILPDSMAVLSDINIITDSAAPAAASGLSDWALGLLIVFIFIIIIFAAAFLFLHMKNKRHKKVNKPGLNSEGVGATNSYVDPSAFDTIPIRNTGAVSAGNQFAPPKYDEIPPYGPHTASSNSGAATTSELSGSDQSGSSGRGSAEDGEDGEDEEIRMINEGPLQRDSGIHRQTDGVDDDNLSDVSVHNTQEYLARLGIVDTVAGGGASTSSRRCSENLVNKDNMLHHGSIDPMHIFDEDGTHENDITNLIYAKLNEVTGSERASSADENSAAVERAMALGAFPSAPGESTAVPTAGPSMTGSLSSIVHSEEELTGSYNWDYLLDWGPQYQPLAHVFSEIARLKDDAVSLQSGNSGASSAKSKGTSISGGKSVPPPLLTTVAPRSCPAPSLSCRQPQHLLPRSPISHDVPGGFSAAAAMSPSFSPSLSPLATRSPSMSPLVGPGLPPNPASRKTHSTMRI